MRLIDTNVLIYAIGRDHPLKQVAGRILSDIVDGHLAANLDAEALQEILHVYSSRRERQKGFTAIEQLLTVFPNPIAIGRDEVESARDLMAKFPFLAARDAVHAAVVRVHQLDGIVTADKVFDRVRGIRRFALR